MSVRGIDKPLAWVGADRILCDDTSRFGLRRKVIARRGEAMDVETWMRAVERQAGEDAVHAWLVDRDGDWFLWIVWKPKRGR